MRRDASGPYSLEALAALPMPTLFETDASVLRAKLIAWFEAETGRTLYPAQVETLLIETLAFAMATLGEEAQAVAEQHLVARAGEAGLERLGPNRSTPRLPAAKARAPLRFTIPQARPSAVYAPAGVRVAAGDVVFATLTPAMIPAGALAADVIAEAVEAGVAGNGFLPGQIATLLDPVAGVSVANVETSAGGADVEAPEAYRLRLANAFERISVGGARGWYVETAFAVSSAIIDAVALRPEPCYVDIYLLTADGPASAELCALVASAFEAEEALATRFGDLVTVKPAEEVSGPVAVTARVRGAASTIEADLEAAAAPVLADWGRLGATLAPSAIDAAGRALAGVLDVETTEPAFARLAPHQFFKPSALVVTVVEA